MRLFPQFFSSDHEPELPPEIRFVRIGATQEFYGYSVEEIMELLRALNEMASGPPDAVRYQPDDYPKVETE